MTVTDLSEQQMQDTCPSFCERTEHQNMSTAEAPLIIHSTGDHNVHGNAADQHWGEAQKAASA